MASEDHKILSGFLKEVHSSLRKASVKLGAEKAWNEHCRNKDILNKYAHCMEKLATKHWENNNTKDSSETTSRIEWAADYCNDYFINKSYNYFSNKEIDIATKNNIAICTVEYFSNPLKLIDVGSCYNPFKVYDFFDVCAIDLCPANEFVMQCDFLNVDVGPCNVVEDLKVLQLQEMYYDVVTFCFLLEYIPSSDLRIKACQKAYEILKYGGLLIINTPDSKHVGANSKIMKCWRYSLALIGFSRVKYEKFKHMHCMAFRKSLHKDIAKRWAHIHQEPYMDYSIHIPQDFQSHTEEGEDLGTSESNTVYAEHFEELPFHKMS